MDDHIKFDFIFGKRRSMVKTGRTKEVAFNSHLFNCHLRSKRMGFYVAVVRAQLLEWFHSTDSDYFENVCKTAAFSTQSTVTELHGCVQYA